MSSKQNTSKDKQSSNNYETNKNLTHARKDNSIRLAEFKISKQKDKIIINRRVDT